MPTRRGRRGQRSSEADPLPNNDEPITSYRSFSPNTNTNTTTTTTRDDPLQAPHTTTTSYRGFDTSITSMFQDVSSERVDCCAMTCCCGMLQSDRDRYLLTGVTPPSWSKRGAVHFVLPIGIFLAAGLGALHIPNRELNQLYCTGMIVCLVGYLWTAFAKGRDKRIRIRKDLLFTKYHVLAQNSGDRDLVQALEQERPEEEDDDDGAVYYMGQGAWDFACAHPPCCGLGLYIDDRPKGQSLLSDDTEHNNSKACLVSCCGMQVQCCGICAIAQEARELERTVLPERYRRIDYVTMQPFLEYYPAIYEAKWRNRREPQQEQQHDPENTAEGFVETTGMSFPPPLSKLSKRLVGWLGTLLFLVLLWSIIGPLYFRYFLKDKLRARIAFHLGDFGVFCLVFVQAFVMLGLLAWFVNRPKFTELSSDAMVKFFASGFFLSTTLAIFWELVTGLLLRITVAILLALGGIDPVADPETSSSFIPWTGGMAMDWIPTISVSGREDFMESFGRDHPFLYTIYIMVITFGLAALVEEVCKYFGYRMCEEHPDFLSRTELREASRIVYGRTHDDDESHHEEAEQQEQHDFPLQMQSHQAQGAAITLAMISVAMGFTCCENLVYVFLYSGSSVQMELSVLLARSIFPVHPLCAAIQSLGVVERDIEKRSDVTKRTILLPAVLFHGAYDFFIVWLDFLAQRGTTVDNDDENDEEAANPDSIGAVLISLALVMGALYFYMKEARKQRQRLATMDEEVTVERSRLI